MIKLPREHPIQPPGTGKMLIETSMRGPCRVIRIRDDLSVQSDLSELKKVIQDYVDQGMLHFALSFTDKSYLYTKSLSAIVQCTEMVRKRGGTMAFIEPNQDIVDILKTISFDTIIKIVPSEDALG